MFIVTGISSVDKSISLGNYIQFLKYKSHSTRQSEYNIIKSANNRNLGHQTEGQIYFLEGMRLQRRRYICV